MVDEGIGAPTPTPPLAWGPVVLGVAVMLEEEEGEVDDCCCCCCCSVIPCCERLLCFPSRPNDGIPSEKADPGGRGRVVVCGFVSPAGCLVYFWARFVGTSAL